jgi:hypothetical protein
MFDKFDIPCAIDVVLGWDLPDASLAFALNAQANLMAGIDPEQIIGFCLR